MKNLRLKRQLESSITGDMGKITLDEVPLYLEMILDKVIALEQMLVAKDPEEKGPRLITIEEAAKLINLKVFI